MPRYIESISLSTTLIKRHTAGRGKINRHREWRKQAVSCFHKKQNLKNATKRDGTPVKPHFFIKKWIKTPHQPEKGVSCKRQIQHETEIFIHEHHTTDEPFWRG